MQKFLFLSILLLPFTLLSLNFDVEARIALLNPQEKLMKNIYGHWISEYELEAAIPFVCDWSAWSNLSYYGKNGRSEGLKDRTKVQDWTFTLGLKRYIPLCFDSCIADLLRPYLGVGVGPAFIKCHDHSRYVKQRVSHWGVEVMGKTGVEVEIVSCFFVDLFADYSYQWFHFRKKSGLETHNINPGGLKLGAGLGYHF